MAARYRKRDYPVERIRRFLEPGPVLLVSSACAGQVNVMTLGWQTVMEFSPSLVGCMISSGNHSFDMIRRSRGCVLNLPTADMVDTVVGIGNCSGARVDKFERFGLRASAASDVSAPLLDDCYANFECRLVDDTLVASRNFFVFEVVRAVAATRPVWPRTLHYAGDGIFAVPGERIDRRRLFDPAML